ncbi:ABC transporter permease [Clostridium hydrogenum]|uniref:ABC transporter permease n=1 Tax=Clostridium hydrogenum TaxID=2855764 RepID=UPI001F3CE220|nr:ABC transporter permease [Clostridium hydrogenum]
MIYMAWLHLKRLLIQSKKVFLLTILMPTVVVCLVTFLLSGSKSNASINIGVVNKDSGIEGKGLLKSLEKQAFVIDKLSYEDAKTKIKQNVEGLVLVIPDNFTEKIQNGEKPSVEILKTENGDMDSSIINQVNAYIGKKIIENSTLRNVIKLGVKVDKNKFNSDMKKASNDKYVTVSSNYITHAGVQNLAGTVSSNLIVSFLMYSMMYIVMDLYALRKEKILFRSLSTPNSNSEILGSIFLSMFVILFMQSALLVTITKFVFNIYWGKSMLSVMLVFLALDLVVLSAGIVAARWAKSEEQISPIVSLMVTLTCAIGGSFMPLDQIPNFPEALKKISYFTPQNWAISALNDVILKNSGVFDILPKLFILLLFAGVFFAAGALQFRETAK